MKISKAMCVLFSGLALLTLAIVVQMNRFVISGFDDKSGTSAAATKPAEVKVASGPQIPWWGWLIAGIGMLILLACFGAALAG